MDWNWSNHGTKTPHLSRLSLQTSRPPVLCQKHYDEPALRPRSPTSSIVAGKDEEPKTDLGNIYRSWVICFWLQEILAQPQPWIHPFCLQVIVVISRLASTLCSHKRERQSEFPQVHKQASKTYSEDHYLNVQGFPLLFVSLTCWQAIYHGPRHKLVLAVCSHSIREQHTVGYPKGKNLFKISCSNRWPYF